MNKNVKWLLIILAVIALTAVLTKFAIYDRLYRTEHYQLDRAATTLIIGASHAEYGLSPEFIENSENVATSGEQLFYTYYKLKNLLANDSNIDRVVLSIFPYTFSKNGDAALFDPKTSPFQVRRFYKLLDAEAREVLKENKRIMLLCYLQYNFGLILPDKSEASAFVKMVMGRLSLSSYSFIEGYHGSKLNHLTESKQNKTIKKYYYDKDDKISGFSEVAPRYLDKIAALCEERGLELVLVRTPEYPPFIAATPMEHEENLKQIALGAAAKYENVEYYDYGLFDLPPTAYLDPDHINSEGSELFSKELNRVLEKR